jgi:hypothetical protein
MNVNVFVFVLTLAFIVIPQAVYKDEVPAVLIVSPVSNVNTSVNSSTTKQPITMTTETSWDVSKAGFLGANTSAVAQLRRCHMVKPKTDHDIQHDVGRLVSDFMQGVVRCL